MPARLVAVQPDVQLQDRRRRAVQRRDARLRASRRKRTHAEPTQRFLTDSVLLLRQGELTALDHVSVELSQLLVFGHLKECLRDERRKFLPSGQPRRLCTGFGQSTRPRRPHVARDRRVLNCVAAH